MKTVNAQLAVPEEMTHFLDDTEQIFLLSVMPDVLSLHPKADDFPRESSRNPGRTQIRSHRFLCLPGNALSSCCRKHSIDRI